MNLPTVTYLQRKLKFERTQLQGERGRVVLNEDVERGGVLIQVGKPSQFGAISGVNYSLNIVDN